MKKQSALFNWFGKYGLGAKLTIAFLVVVLVAIGIETYIANRTITRSLAQNAGNVLREDANEDALAIGDFLLREVEITQALSLNRILQSRLIIANDIKYKTDDIDQIRSDLEQLDEEWLAADDLDSIVTNTLIGPAPDELLRFRAVFPDHLEIFITDKYGGLVAATNRTSDYYQADEEWWQRAFNDGSGDIYISAPEFDESANSLSLLIAVPVFEEDELIGILRTTYNTSALTDFLAILQTDQSSRSEIYLPNGFELKPGVNELEEADFDLTSFDQPQAVSEGYLDTLYNDEASLVSWAQVKSPTGVGVIEDLNWQVVTRQSRSDALALVQAQTQSTLLTGLFIAIGAIIAALIVAQLLVSPIRRLTAVAQAITEGDLQARAEVNTGDEIAILGTALNTMTDRLRDTIEGLENQVGARTQQIEAVLEVSQQLNEIFDLSDLLRQVVTLTKERFDYYHVHIYLLDSQKENLVMTEGYGLAGEQMKREGHSIPLFAQQSIVARAARREELIVVGNVREYSSWLPNPLLPDTLSEAAVPIISAGNVLGVLDIQSNQIDGLTVQDEAPLQVLASQIASVIRNANLFTETQDKLYDAQRLQRLYTGQAWERLSDYRDSHNYEIRQTDALPLEQLSVPEFEAALQANDTVKLQTINGGPDEMANGAGHNAVATPLKLRGQIIGVLGLHTDDPDRQWAAEEIALIEAVSEQMSLALENARLFEETGRRATREKLIADMTTKVWASSELEQVLKTAVEELGTNFQASEVVIRLGTEAELQD